MEAQTETLNTSVLLAQLRKLAWLVGIVVVAAIADMANIFQLSMGINQAQEVAMVILIITATLWVTELVPLYVTSFVVLFLQIVWLLPLIKAFGGTASAHDFLSPFFSNIILLFLGGFVLSAMLHKFGLDQRMARFVINRIGSRPSRLLMGIMVISAVLSMWMSNTATTAMMFAVVLPIIAKIPKENRFAKALALSIPFACNLGGLGTPIGTPPNAIALTFLNKSGVTISFAKWMLLSVPLLLVFLVFLWFLLLKLYPPGSLKIDIEEKGKRPMVLKHYICVVIFLVTCLGWLTTKYHPLSTGTVSLIPIVACFGFGLLDVDDFRSLSWDVLFMLGGGLTLGVGLKASGLTSEIVSLVPTHPGVIIVLFSFLAAVMTTFMSNTATANLIIPIAVSIGDGLTSALVVSVAFMCSTAMALPVSTPPNAIAYGSGILKARDMILPGLIITVVAFLSVMFVGTYYWKLIGL